MNVQSRELIISDIMAADNVSYIEALALTTRLQKNAFRDYFFTNCRIKTYLCKETVQVCSASIFSEDTYKAYDESMFARPYSVSPKGCAADPVRSREESKRRARSAVMDIAMCNNFDYMLTWTLDEQQIDRYDKNVVYKALRSFLSNKTQRDGFRYVIVPEYHKLCDGDDMRAIHFHGLCNLGSVDIKPALRKNGSQRIQYGRPVFNMTDWKYGFSTVVPLDRDSSGRTTEHACAYIAKYITKSGDKPFGKWYLSSRNLDKRPDITVCPPVNYDDFSEQNKDATPVTVYGTMRILKKDVRFSEHNASD